MNTKDKFAVSPFREMVVHLHPYLERQDIIKMAYLLELSPKFEEEMGTSRDPLLFFIREASNAGKVTPNNVDLLMDALLTLNMPADVIEVVINFEEVRMLSTPGSSSASAVWKKIVPRSDTATGSSEKDYKRIMVERYWVKFTEWCSRQNISEPKKVPCKKVIEYLFSLTSAMKSPAVMNYYRAILKYHQEFKPIDKAKLELCIKEIRNQEKKVKL
ncbi:hypothetical protein HOLleu_16066 [Holothuria leucospilota]|uniref:Uncharacterized protein n=1 Tax=Holothuria leucospilota TaxID=206669 RepID=A0A9Q1C5I1_HOLLE|nr:hypothetical protein HOLleu_16066 [Holothuria leucospilota]